MITDEMQMVELMKLIQQNPDAAAKILATSGMTPEQVMSVGAPSMGTIMAPGTEAGISSAPPRYMGFMQPGSATPGPSTPTDRFTLPGQGEVPMPQPAVTKNLIDLEPPVLPGEGPRGGPQVAGWSSEMQPTAWNQPTPGELAQLAAPIGQWDTTVNPATPQPGLGTLMAGLKGLPAGSSDVKPIFGANAPGPRDIVSGKVAQGSPSIDMLMKLIMGGVKGPAIPSLGGLMRG